MIAATGTIHKIGRFSSNGHTTKPVICADIANKSMITLIARRPSFDERESKPRIPKIVKNQRCKYVELFFEAKIISFIQVIILFQVFALIFYLLCDDNNCIPGMQHKQFVTIAAFTESNSGKTRNINKATPIVCNDSITKMNRKCERCGRFHDLKKQIRSARMNAPISGMENAISNAHIHATRSSSGITDTNDLSRPYFKIWKNEN